MRLPLRPLLLLALAGCSLVACDDSPTGPGERKHAVRAASPSDLLGMVSPDVTQACGSALPVASLVSDHASRPAVHGLLET